MSGISGITEGDIADYLANTPGFFERHAELLASIQLTSPHGHRAVSLQERQMEMLRDKIKGLEQRIIEMIRHAQDNVGLADRLHRWLRALVLTDEPSHLPAVLLAELKHEFLIPQAALRLWSVAEPYVSMPFAVGASDDAKSFAASLVQPYCGPNAGFEAVRWLDEPATVTSVAIVPLRRQGASGERGAAFGLLVLGSPDPTRYSADMGTEFLVRVGELASAALHRLLPSRE